MRRAWYVPDNCSKCRERTHVARRVDHASSNDYVLVNTEMLIFEAVAENSHGMRRA